MASKAQRYFDDMNELFDVIAHESGDENQSVIKLCEELSKLAKTHHRLQENACNYEPSKWQLGRERNIEKRIVEIAAELNLAGVKFSGDPRGCTVKLLLKSGKTNDFGNEGYCIPTF